MYYLGPEWEKGYVMDKIRYIVKSEFFTSETAVFKVEGLLEMPDSIVEIFEGNVLIKFNIHSLAYWVEAEYEVLNLSSDEEQKDDENKNEIYTLLISYILASIYRAIERFYFVCPGGNLARIKYTIIGIPDFEGLIVDTTETKITAVNEQNEKIPVT